jgi:hypothetical protein
MNSTIDCYFPMSVELQNKKKYNFECKVWHIYYTWNIIFSIYIGMVEILWRSMAQGIWI